LSDIFHDLSKNPDLLDADSRQLLNSFEQLRAPTVISNISNPSAGNWIPDEIGKRDSSFVKLSLDSKSVLMAVKTSQSQEYAELIKRDAAFLKTLKHPLVLELHGDISNRPDHNSAIVTEFAWNGSLASYFTSSQCRLSGVNRITKIIVGIALAMRFVHSRGVIHRDLQPDNILLNSDWIVQIADFGQSISPDIPNISSFVYPHRDPSLPSIVSHYLAPECYDNQYSQMSDVFSFGLIVYELLVGKPAFSTELSFYQIAQILAVKDERPVIPDFVLPTARQLITDCWAEEPGDRPSFEGIAENLKEMKFKLTAKVNSLKFLEFMTKIEDWEVFNEVASF
jgi:serine/threonine protein kinase